MELVESEEMDVGRTMPPRVFCGRENRNSIIDGRGYNVKKRFCLVFAP